MYNVPKVLANHHNLGQKSVKVRIKSIIPWLY